MNPLEQIQSREERLREAMLAGDVNELEALIADEAIVSGPDGQLSDKASDIAAHQDGSLRIRTMLPKELKVQMLGEVAIVFALMAMEGIFEGKAFAGRFRYIRIWHHQDGIWRVVAAHICSIAD